VYVESELVAAWTVEWVWLVGLSLGGIGLALLVHLRLPVWLQRNLELEPDSIGFIVAQTTPAYLAWLVILLTLDILAESALHMPRSWYLPTSLVLFALAVGIIFLMIRRIKRNIFSQRYEPIRRRRRARKSREDLSKS
jgi:hypothetical protein